MKTRLSTPAFWQHLITLLTPNQSVAWWAGGGAGARERVAFFTNMTRRRCGCVLCADREEEPHARRGEHTYLRFASPCPPKKKNLRECSDTLY